MDQLKPGRKYELIITDHSGFYRYRMKDVVLVTGTHNAAPMVEFQYRTDKTVSLMGEKTTEAALRFAEEETAKECGFLLVDSSGMSFSSVSPITSRRISLFFIFFI